MNPQVFVVDTNVVVAGLITRSGDSPVAKVLNAMLSGKLLYLLSPALLVEYRSVLLRPRISALHGLGDTEVDTLLTEVTANAIWRQPVSGPIAPDRGDDHLWALLGSHEGSILITGDRLLRDQPPPGRSAIAADTWLTVFASRSG